MNHLSTRKDAGSISKFVQGAGSGCDLASSATVRPKALGLRDQAAIMVAKIATREISESEATGDVGEHPTAKALGAKGEKARDAKMDPERRAEIARKTAAKR